MQLAIRSGINAGYGALAAIVLVVVGASLFAPRLPPPAAVAATVIYRDQDGRRYTPEQWALLRTKDNEFWRHLRETPAPPPLAAHRPIEVAVNFAERAFNHDDYDYQPQLVPSDRPQPGKKVVRVRAYTKKNGTFVHSYMRSLPRRRR